MSAYSLPRGHVQPELWLLVCKRLPTFVKFFLDDPWVPCHTELNCTRARANGRNPTFHAQSARLGLLARAAPAPARVRHTRYPGRIGRLASRGLAMFVVRIPHIRLPQEYVPEYPCAGIVHQLPQRPVDQPANEAHQPGRLHPYDQRRRAHITDAWPANAQQWPFCEWGK